MKKALAVALVLALSAPAGAQEFSAWLWPSKRADLQTGEVYTVVSVMVQSDSVLGTALVTLEYDHNVFTPVGFSVPSGAYGMWNPAPPVPPTCGWMGAGDNRTLMAAAAFLGGLNVASPRSVIQIDFATEWESLQCHAEAIKFYCNAQYNGQYMTEFSTIGGYAYYYGSPNVALANACVYEDPPGCYGTPACPEGGYPYSSCGKCPPVLNKSEARGLWGTAKGRYR